jgi:hypothetical protein
LDRSTLASTLVLYPHNKVETSGAVIPFVETCHRGPIRITAITYCLLVCSANCAHFYRETDLADPRLAEVEAEFLKVSPADGEERAHMAKAIDRSFHSPEFEAQVQKAKEAMARAKDAERKSSE